MYVDIKNRWGLYVDIKVTETIVKPDVCGHKQKTGIYLYKEFHTIENPDVCGHKEQIGLYVDIEVQI